jgi:hypothetical protein
MSESKPLSYEARIRKSPEFALRELSAHFDHNSAVYRTLYRLAERLDEAKIPYALAGALAMNEHGYERATTDVDLIMTREGLEQFREQFVGRGYRLAFPGARKTFRDIDTQVKIEVIAAGDYPGDGKPKRVSFPDPRDAIVINRVHVVPLGKLIELKLASGMTAPQRLRDLSDTQDMIRTLGLPIALKDKLDASVGEEYERLWHTVNDVVDPFDEERASKK